MPITGLDRMPGSGLARGTLFDKELNVTEVTVPYITATTALIFEKSAENKYTITWTQPTGGDKSLLLRAMNTTTDYFVFENATQTLTNKELGAGTTITAGTVRGITDLEVATSASSGESTTLFGDLASNTLVLGTGTSTIQVAGNFTVSGTNTIIDTTTLTTSDNLIYLNQDYTIEDPLQDSGFLINRGGTEANVAMMWDESEDEFAMATTTQLHDATVLTPATYTNLHVGALTLTDDAAIGLDIKEAGNSYMKFVTTQGSEKIVLGKELQGSNFNIDGGNIATEVVIAKSPTITLTGDVTASATAMTNLGDVSLATTITADSVALGTDTTGNYVTTITGGTGITASGATTGQGIAHSLSIDLNEVTEAVLVNGDYLAFIDATDNGTKKEAVADLATLFAGGGLTATNSVIGVNASQTQITSVGTITVGEWQGDTVAVNQGGTGATSLTDGGVILGSAANAVTAMARLANSEMIVGQASGDPVIESGDTLRQSIGVGSTNTWQITGLNIGHADDTTLTRVGTGDLQIEDKIIYRAGGTNVAVADGGTGQDNLTNLITLTTHTQGNYIASITSGTGLSGGVASEGGTPTLDVDAVQTQITDVGDLDEGSITSNFGNINIGTSTFTTTGNVSVGNLTVTGATTYVNSTELTVVDPIINLQTASGGEAIASDTNKDVGLALHYHTGSAAKIAFLGFDDTDSKLMYVPDASISSEVVSGSIGTIKANLEGTIGAANATTIVGTTINATTNFTIGDTVVTNGVVTDSTGLQLLANLDIDGTADISGDLTLSAGGDGALRFSAASSIKILDDSATALVIEEADNAYITFDTRNGAEKILISKAVEFDGALDIDGAVQIDATFTSGVNGQGYDTKFFGDTTGAYIMWDTNVDKLLTAGGAVIDIVKDKLLIGGTAVTTTAAELNYSDTGAAVGTVVASKVVTVDASKDVGDFRNVTLTGDLVAANLDISVNVDVDGTLEADIITVNGTALNTVIAGVTVTNATLAAGATVLATARNIGGVSFNGSAPINLPGVNIAGNQATSGLAATATALATARNIGGVSFDGTAAIVPNTITVADTTDTSSYVALFESATGDLAPKTDAGITYNAGTGTLTATAFSGPLTGAASQVVVTDTVDTSTFVALFDSATGDLAAKTDASLTYNADTATLSVTNMNVSGTTTTTNTTITSTTDSMFKYASGNDADAVDFGFYGLYVDSGNKYSGLFRDASDSDKWKLFATTGNSNAEPGDTVNTTSAFTLATLAVASLEGTIATAAQNSITSASTLATVGTITTGVWNAGAVTSSGAIEGASLVADLITIDSNTISTSSGNLTLTAGGSTGDVLIGDGDGTILYVDGGTGGIGINTAANSNRMVYIGGSFTGNTNAYALGVEAALTPGGTNGSIYGLRAAPSMNGSSGQTHGLFATVYVGEPSITVNSSTITEAVSLYIEAAPDEGAVNYALHVDAGTSRFDGDLIVDGDLDFTGPQEISTTSGTLTLNPATTIEFNGNTVNGSGNFYTNTATGAAIFDEAASATNPTLIPNRAEGDTGIGWASADNLSLITGGAERMRISGADVGIGTTPSYRLHVKEDYAEVVAKFHGTNTNSGWNMYFLLENDGGGDLYLSLLQGSAQGYLKYTDANEFKIQTDGMNDRATFKDGSITFNENVGIGATPNSWNRLILSGNIGNGYGSSYIDMPVAAAVTATNGENQSMVQFKGTITEGSSGASSLFTNLKLLIPVVTNGAGSVTNTATFYIEGAMSAGTSTNYAMHVASGTSLFGGSVGINHVPSSNGKLHITGDESGSSLPAIYIDAGGFVNTMFMDMSYGAIFWSGGIADGTGRGNMRADQYVMGRNQDSTNQFQFNVPTGAGFEWSINRTAKMILNSSGNVGIGAAPTAKLHLAPASGEYGIKIEGPTHTAFARAIQITETWNNSGVGFEPIFVSITNTASDASASFCQFTQNGSKFNFRKDGLLTIASTLTENSDSRVKTNIQTLSSALSKVTQMRGVSFDRLDGADSGVGLVAQELELIAPELVKVGKDTILDDGTEIEDVKGVTYSNLVAYLVEAIKELKVEIDALKAA